MKKVIFIIFGLFCILLGVIGVILPVMPGIIFFAMAGYFFSKSSPYLHGQLLRLPYIGPAMNDWDQFGIMTWQTKFSLVTFCFTTTIITGYFSKNNLAVGVILLNFSLIALFSIIAIDKKET